MKLGLIQCDYVPIPLQSTFGDYPEMFKEAFGYSGVSLDWVVIDICSNGYDLDLTDFDGFIISGSRSSVNDKKPWIEKLETLIRQIVKLEVPLVGLCFGHQAIAKALGGRVSKSRSGWNIGSVAVELNSNGQSILDVSASTYFYAFHQDCVEILPNNASCLGSTSLCENFIVEFQKGVFGFQGHPEFDVAYMRGLLDINIAGLDNNSLALIESSLDKTPNSGAVRRFILSYLMRHNRKIS